MKKLFESENPVIAFLAKLADAVVLHVLWLVCCLPVVTIGPATVALYYVFMKSIRNEGSRYYRMYFRAFRENFRKGMLLGLVFLLGAGVLLGVLFLYRSLWQAYGMTVCHVMIYVTAALILIWLMIFQYAFPLLARFDNSVMKTVSNAFFLMVGNFGWTLAMAALFVIFYLSIFYLFAYLFPLIIWGYGLVALIDAHVLDRIFQPYADRCLAEEEESRARAEEELKKRGLMTTVELAAKAERDEEIQRAGIWPPIGTNYDYKEVRD